MTTDQYDGWMLRRIDQVPRREAFEREHPDVRIWQSAGCWRAESAGLGFGPCIWLGDLLDRLEMALDGPESNGDGPGQHQAVYPPYRKAPLTEQRGLARWPLAAPHQGPISIRGRSAER